MVAVVGTDSSVAAAENVEIISAATYVIKPDRQRHVANLVPRSSDEEYVSKELLLSAYHALRTNCDNSTYPSNGAIPCSSALKKPSCLQTVSASFWEKPSLHTVPHLLLR